MVENPHKILNEVTTEKKYIEIAFVMYHLLDGSNVPFITKISIVY